MRCDDLTLIQAWIVEWRNCGVTFERDQRGDAGGGRPYLEPKVGRSEEPTAGS